MSCPAPRLDSSACTGARPAGARDSLPAPTPSASCSISHGAEAGAGSAVSSCRASIRWTSACARSGGAARSTSAAPSSPVPSARRRRATVWRSGSCGSSPRMTGPAEPGAVVAVVCGEDFDQAASGLRDARARGWAIVAVLVRDDDAVLIGNRFDRQIPIVDEVTDAAGLPFGGLAAVEVAAAGGAVEALADPLAVADLLALAPVGGPPCETRRPCGGRSAGRCRAAQPRVGYSRVRRVRAARRDPLRRLGRRPRRAGARASSRCGALGPRHRRAHPRPVLVPSPTSCGGRAGCAGS